MGIIASPEKSKAVKSRKERIAILNDRLRTTGIGGQIMLTRGVADLGVTLLKRIMEAVHTYSTWTKDNDPWDEHDFGIITLPECPKIYFKIDYYDKQLEFGSEDPADPEKTTRVLTVMLAEEY